MEPFELSLSGHTVCEPEHWRSAGSIENYHRLYIPCAGRAEIFDEVRTIVVGPGKVHLIPGMRRRGYRCPVRFEVDWIHFRARDLRTEAVIGRLDGGVAWAAEEWEFWRPVYTRLHELSKPDSKLLRARVQAMLLYFIAGVIDEHHASQEHASLMDVVNRMSPAVEFMDRHFLDNPGLDQIAASVKLSPTHFHRAFRAAFRTTPHAYMLRKRMDLAWSLLAEGELNVNEVADRLRYVNVFYFSRVFKAYFDAAPSKVRSNRSAARP